MYLKCFFILQIAREKEAREGGGVGAAGVALAAAAPQVQQQPAAAKKEYTETRLQVAWMPLKTHEMRRFCKTNVLQIRLLDGSSLTQSFGVKEPLAAVRLFVQQKSSDFAPFHFMVSFPRKVFGEDEMETPLSALGDSLPSFYFCI